MNQQATSLHPEAPSRVNPWCPDFATIQDVQDEAPGIKTYELAFEDEQVADRYRFLPGQFNMVFLPGIGEAAISLSSDPARPRGFAHTVRAAGNVTQAMARLRPGDQVGIRGPYGTAWPTEACKGLDLVIASGGVGLAPLRPVLYHLLHHRGDFGRVILVYGARGPGDLLFTREYDTWRRGGIEVETTVDIGDADWRGNIGVVPVLFYRLRLHPARTRLFTCGPEVMIRFVVFEALARRVKPEHVYLSMERNMKCAVGLCGHCQIGPAFVCKEGPVFTYQQMARYLHVEDL
ncbi:MAG: FAD/NAD(P)-binding protein [Gemmataceae bacterium]